MDNQIENITTNPMYYFSLGSKELFHSNFWKWLYIENWEETIKLFTDSSFSERPNVEREKKLYNGVVADFYIEGDGKKIIVENKIKDYPYAEQLKKEEAAAGEDAKCVLVTLIPYNGYLPENFTVMTYMELSQKINPAKFSNDPKIKSYIEDYKNMIYTLSDIMPKEEEKELNKYNFARSYKQYTDLDNIKFAEVYQKYRASHFCHEIIIRNDEFNSTDYKVNYNLFHGHGVINVHTKIKNHNDANIWAGVQIENNQFRLMIHGELMKDYNKEKLKKFSSEFWEKNGIGKVKQGRNENGYCKYGETCWYKYEYILHDEPYSELFRKIKTILDSINELKILL